MKTKEEIMDIIRHSTGTESYHKFSPLSGYPVITDGVKALEEAAELRWMLEKIGEFQLKSNLLDPKFQVWRLLPKKGVLRGYNGTVRKVSEKVETDFPSDELRLYLVDGVLMLTSEFSEVVK